MVSILTFLSINIRIYDWVIDNAAPICYCLELFLDDKVGLGNIVDTIIFR